jgi:uncharacterized protein YqeY
VGEEEFVVVVQRGVKQRKDSVEQYRNCGRERPGRQGGAGDRGARHVSAGQVSPSEVRAAVEELVRAEGLSGPRRLGKVMGTILRATRVASTARRLQQIAREVCSGA